MANLFSLEYGKVSALNAVFAEEGLTAEQGEAILKDHSIARIMVAAALAALATVGENIAEAFTALVNYLVQPTLVELRRAFDWVNDAYDRAKFEPIEICRGIDRTNREVAFRYFKINRRMTTKQILAAMDKAGLRPAIYEELLAFASKYPDEQRKFPIVALGSIAVLGGLVRVAYLDEYERGRDLDLHYGDPAGGWGDVYVFLAVSK